MLNLEPWRYEAIMQIIELITEPASHRLFQDVLRSALKTFLSHSSRSLSYAYIFS